MTQQRFMFTKMTLFSFGLTITYKYANSLSYNMDGLGAPEQMVCFGAQWNTKHQKNYLKIYIKNGELSKKSREKQLGVSIGSPRTTGSWTTQVNLKLRKIN